MIIVTTAMLTAASVRLLVSMSHQVLLLAVLSINAILILQLNSNTIWRYTIYLKNGKWAFKLTSLYSLCYNQISKFWIVFKPCSSFLTRCSRCWQVFTVCSRKFREIKLAFLTVLLWQLKTGQVLRKGEQTLVCWWEKLPTPETDMNIKSKNCFS